MIDDSPNRNTTNVCYLTLKLDNALHLVLKNPQSNSHTNWLLTHASIANTNCMSIHCHWLWLYKHIRELHWFIFMHISLRIYMYISKWKLWEGENRSSVQCNQGSQSSHVCYSVVCLCSTIDGLVVECNWLLQRITLNRLLQRAEFTKWKLSSLKTRLWTTYLHCRSISLMFPKLQPDQTAVLFYYSCSFGAFTCWGLL